MRCIYGEILRWRTPVNGAARVRATDANLKLVLCLPFTEQRAAAVGSASSVHFERRPASRLVTGTMMHYLGYSLACIVRPG